MPRRRARTLRLSFALLLGLCLACGATAPDDEEALTSDPVRRDRAVALFDQGDYAGSERLLRAYLEDFPEDDLAHSSLGFALLEQDRVDDAEHSFLRAQQLRPTNPDFELGLGRVARSRGRDDLARQHYQNALAQNPNDAEVLGSLLVVECVHGNYDEAVSLGERAERLSPSDPRTAANLSIAYHYVGNRAGRDRAYQSAQRLGYDGMANLDAIFRGERVVGPGSSRALLPDDPDEAELARATRDFDQRNFASAVTRLEALLARRADLMRGWSTLGFAQLELDHVDEAETAFERARALDPNFTDVYLGLGRVHRERGENEEAMAAYRRALEINPNDAEVLASMVVVALIRGDYDEAVRLGERAHTIDGDEPVVAANLSVAYHYTGQAAQRDEMYGIAMEFGYHNGPFLQQVFRGESDVGPGSDRAAPPPGTQPPAAPATP